METPRTHMETAQIADRNFKITLESLYSGSLTDAPACGLAIPESIKIRSLAMPASWKPKIAGANSIIVHGTSELTRGSAKIAHRNSNIAHGSSYVAHRS